MAAPRRSAMQAPPWGQEDPQPQEHDTAWEASHQRFRQFQYEDAAGLREAFCQLWELCFQWLRPQTRSVEQILALSVMEKFLQILPADTETRRNMLSPEIRERIFTLIEDLPKDSWGPDTKITELLVPEEAVLIWERGKKEQTKFHFFSFCTFSLCPGIQLVKKP
ncbi:zinc finger protein 449-like [Sigmodon hispidus]